MPPRPATARPAGRDDSSVGARELRLFACAARGELTELISLCGQRPSLVHAVDTHGATALHHAAHHGEDGAVAFLLQHGADPNAANEAGDTPLHLALQSSRAHAVIGRLLAHGASALQRDRSGRLPLQLAAALADDGARQLVEEASERETARLASAVSAQQAELRAMRHKLALLSAATRPPPATRRVLVLGLDGSGKSSLCASAMRGGAPEPAGAAPPERTAGANISAVGRADAPPHSWLPSLAGDRDLASISLELMDVGGAAALRAYWDRFVADGKVALVAFVVDASEADGARRELAAREHARVAELCARRPAQAPAAPPAVGPAEATVPAAAPLPLVVLANKCDLRGAIPPQEVEALLRARPADAAGSAVRAAPPIVLPCSARTGAGVAGFLEWCARRLCPAQLDATRRRGRGGAPGGIGPLHELRRVRGAGERGVGARDDTAIAGSSAAAAALLGATSEDARGRRHEAMLRARAAASGADAGPEGGAQAPASRGPRPLALSAQARRFEEELASDR